MGGLFQSGGRCTPGSGGADGGYINAKELKTIVPIVQVSVESNVVKAMMFAAKTEFPPIERAIT